MLIKDIVPAEGVAEGALDKINSILNRRAKKKNNDIRIEFDGHKDEYWVNIYRDKKSLRPIGTYTFRRNGMNLEATDIWVKPDYRGKGFTKMIYAMLKDKGFKVRRSADQTDDGKRFWDKNRPGSVAGDVWEQDMTEGKHIFDLGAQLTKNGEIK